MPWPFSSVPSMKPIATDTVLFEVKSTPGANGHSHKLRVLSVIFPDNPPELYLEVSEPGKCPCTERWPLSEVIHLLLNAQSSEVFAISCRATDAAGHVHH